MSYIVPLSLYRFLHPYAEKIKIYSMKACILLIYTQLDHYPLFGTIAMNANLGRNTEHQNYARLTMAGIVDFATIHFKEVYVS